jgi:signal transduction histidine kinase/DNA-binding response OmpR family regulator
VRIRVPLVVKILTPLVVLVALAVGVSGYRIFKTSVDHWQTEMDARLEHVAALVASTVDPNLLQQVQLPTDVDNDVYTQIKRPMDTAVTASNVEWVGIYYRQGDRLYYWVDTSSTGVGYPFFYYTPEHLAAFDDMEQHRVIYTDEFGSYYGYVAPIIVEGDNGPQVIGIVEASLAAESAQLLEQATLNTVLPILIAGIVSAAVVTTLITFLVLQRPLLQLKRGALALAEGDLGHTIPLRSHDELGDLAVTFNQMSAQLASLYGELQDYNKVLEQRVTARTAELQTERNRLDTILQNVADGLVVTDPRGRIVLVNPAFTQILQMAPDQLLGDVLERVFPAKELKAILEACLKQPGDVQTATLQWVVPGARASAVSAYKASASALVRRDVLTGGTLEVLGVVTVLRDITHETEVDRMKTEFISMVSHELRTPLTSVLGFAKLIGKSFERDIAPKLASDDQRGQQAAGRIHENLDIIVSEAERLTRLINDVLDIAKMEAGKIEWHLSDVALGDVVQTAIATTSSQAEAKGLYIQATVEEGLPLVQADRDRMVQVLANLLSNAIKFTDQGGIEVRVLRLQVAVDGVVVPNIGGESGLLPAGRWVAVSVQDTGIGIPSDSIPEVFQKFKQLGDAMTNRPKGTGLGLAICREIIDHHSGRIWVQSTVGAGSTFTFVLPLAHVHPVALEELRRRVAETLPEPQGGQPVLVVDDEAHIRQLLAQELSNAGYQVLEASDGLEAVNRARRDKPALIILDMMMPQMSGLDVLRVLKGDPATSGIPVLVLSVMEDREQGLRLGADEYLTKPVESDRLLQTIASLLARARRGEGHKKVLVIDEDASAIETIGRVLRERGYEVVEAGDGEAGLEQARRENPDLVILDAMISRMDDYRILKALKAESREREVCVIVLTATASPDEIEELLEHGADGAGGAENLPEMLK